MNIEKVNNKTSEYIEDFGNYKEINFFDDYFRNKGRCLVKEKKEDDELMWEENKYDYEYIVFRSMVTQIALYWHRSTEDYVVEIGYGCERLFFHFPSKKKASEFQGIILEWKLTGRTAF